MTSTKCFIVICFSFPQVARFKVQTQHDKYSKLTIGASVADLFLADTVMSWQLVQDVVYHLKTARRGSITSVMTTMINQVFKNESNALKYM